MASIYADENFDFPVVVELRRLGHDVLTASEAGQAGMRVPDPQVLAYGTSHNRAVLTFNRRDFIRLHGMSPKHAGIIVCTRDDDFVALAVRIDSAVNAVPSLSNQLIRIVRPNTPLQP